MTRVAFVADDLTGASDVLAQAHRLGLRATLLIGEADESHADADVITDEQVIGVATPSRSQHGERLVETVRQAVERVAAFDPDLLIYKVCSTFDSSPTIGNIADAIGALAQRYPDHGPVPVAPAQPAFGRYTLFSTHFARAGDEVHRLDRHPVMSRHPSTPMHESDLRAVLAEQFGDDTVVPGLHLPDWVGSDSGDAWSRHRASDAPAFVVDAVEDDHLRIVADHLLAQEARPSLVVGSGGIMTGIGLALGGEASEPPAQRFSSGPVLAVSASASPTTATQIDHAVAHGWQEIPLPLSVWESGLPESLVEQVCETLAAGQDVVVHTARGPEDPRVAEGGALDPEDAGRVLAELVRRAVERGLTRDVAVLGGDTSTQTLLALGVRTLRVAELFVVGAPVCRADEDSTLAGARVLLKGGQVGGPDVLTAFAGQRRDTTP